MEKQFDEITIRSLLKELDKKITSPCSIVICGGAAAIVGYGLNRVTGDIDILEPLPKTEAFYKSVTEFLAAKGLDPKSINDGAKGFVDYLSPGYLKRVVPLDEEFENLEVSIIGKADLITMKICAWRESDMHDVKSIGISQEDLPVINENIAYLARHSPDRAYKAQLVLSEIGAQSVPEIKAENVKSLSELIQFYNENCGKDISLEKISGWKNEIASGIKPAFLAGLITKNIDLPAKKGSSI